MSRVQRLLSRFKAEFGSQLVSMASSGLLMVLLARLLGPDQYGLLFLAVAVFGVAGIFTKLGIAKSTARYLAEYKERNPEQVPHILRVSLWLNLGTILVVGLVLLLGHRFLATALGEPSLAPFLLFGVSFLAFETLAVWTRVVMQGFEEIRLAAAILAVDRVSRLTFAGGLVVAGFGALGALGGYTLGFAVASALGIWVLYRRYYRGLDAATSIEQGLLRRMSRYTVPLTATSTANILEKRVDTILVGLFLDTTAVSHYVVGKQFVQFVGAPASALGFTLSPSFGAQKADGNVEEAARIYEEALVHSLLVYVPAAAGVILVAGPTVELVFGDGYLGAVPVLQVLALYAVLQSVTKITSNGLDFLGRAKDRAVVKTLTAVLNAGLNVLLVPTVGVVGAAVATVLTFSLYTGANVFIVHQEFDLRLDYLARRFSLVVAITVAMTVVVSLIAGYIDGWVSLAATVLLGCSVWGVLSVLTGLVDVRRIVAHL